MKCQFTLLNLNKRVVSKVSDLTQDERLLGRDLNRSRCHLHTSSKLFFGHGPWLHGHRPQHTSVLSLSPWIHGLRSRKLHRSVMVTPAPYSMAACPEFHIGCRLGQELFTLPIHYHRCSWSGLRPKRLYHTCNVVVTPAPV